MNIVLLQTQSLNGAANLAQFGANWLVQSSLLLVVGLCVGRLLRGRGSAVQSTIYRTALVAVLACPLVTWMLAMAGIPGSFLNLPAAWAFRESNGAPVLADANPSSPVPTSPGPGGVIATSERPRHVDSDGVASREASVSIGVPLTKNQSLRISAAPTAITSGSPDLVVRSFGRIAMVFSLIWLVVAAGLLVRLAGAWRGLTRIRRSAVDAEPDTLTACRQIAERLAITAPEVKHSPYLPSPCLTGLRRPVVLLPEEFEAVSLGDVLIHELAHLRRRDCHWSLLARLATAVFFFQPLLWVLSRRIDATAEEVCDDYVVQLGSDRSDYAHRLVEIAALSVTPLAAAAVGIVSVKSMLARRVMRITDRSRCLSTRVGTLLLVLVITGGLLVTAAAGLVGLDSASAAEDEGDSVSAAPARTDGRQADTAADAGHDKFTVRGRVVDSDGKPLAGAHVAAVASSTRVRQGGDFTPGTEVFGEAVTDEEGAFRLSLAQLSTKTHRNAMIIARIDGKGIAWQQLNLEAAGAEASLTFPSEEPIRGRFVDSQGKPASDVRFWVRSVQLRANDQGRAGGVFIESPHPPAAWLPEVSSDEGGRFTIRGVPTGHGVYFEINDDRFARQGISLNTGAPEERGKYDGTYRPQVKNVNPGEEALIALVSSRFFEGIVRYADTHEAIPNARVTIWASQEEHGSMVSVAGQTGADGKYRICPNPGIRFGILAYPPDGSPYLIRQIPDLRWDDEDATVKQVDLSLPRGVLVRGKVVESGTEKPVVGASVQYVPEEANNSHDADDIVTGWQNIRLSNEQGQFEIGVLPGPGRLFVHGPVNEYVVRQSSSRELSRGKPGGQRVYAHAIEKLDPEIDSNPVEVALTLERSPVITGEIVDQQGSPVAEALMISRLNIRASWLRWQAIPQTILDGRFQIAGLTAGEECPIYFLDPKRQLGATVVVKAGDGPVRVVLMPCGRATMRLVDSEGKPVADFDQHEMSDEMIVTPGVSKFAPPGLPVSRLGLLQANTDFIANIDRVNYGSLESDEQGHFTLPALIPGAIYSITVGRDGQPVVAKTFEAKANETIDLGDIVVDRPDST